MPIRMSGGGCRCCRRGSSRCRAGVAVSISPSAVENVLRCSLRAVLERAGGRTAPIGAPDRGHRRSRAGARRGARRARGRARRGTRRVAGAVGQPDALAARPSAQADPADDRRGARTGSDAHHPPWAVAGTELRIKADLPPVTADQFPDGVLPAGLAEQDAARPVVITGRLDWLSHDEAGRAVVVDFKTTATPQSKAGGSAESAAGGLPDRRRRESGPSTRGRWTTGLPEEGRRRNATSRRSTRRVGSTWLGTIRTAAAQLASADQTATVNSYCDICSVRTSCPLQPDGRQVL